MSKVDGSQVYKIINKVMSIMNSEILDHGRIVSYIFYKMLQTDGHYNRKDMAEYAMLGLLHDIGIMKTGYKASLAKMEETNLWGHSIYGYLFFKYLSPIDDKAEVILYHHLDYNKHKLIPSAYIKESEYLTLADKMDMFMRENDDFNMEKDYFVKNVNVTFSGDALQLFYKAQEKYDITKKLSTGEYIEELDNLFAKVNFDDEHIKMYLQMIVYCIDFRSQQTVLHALSTTTYAECIGRIMGVRGDDVEDLYFGALLHDIGKIAIPLSILESPRRLDDKEMRIMKAHVIITEKILEGIVEEGIFKVAVRHHEKLDGTGYPYGVGAENLNMIEQIAAVADILSALRGKRSYKDEMPKEKIISILSGDAEAGKLNKKIVDSVVTRYDDIMEFYDGHMIGTQSTYMEILAQYDSIYANFKKYE